MKASLYIAKKISGKSSLALSKLIIKIAIGGIALGLAVMILALAVVRGFKSEIRNKARSFSGDIQIVKYSANPTFENNILVLDDALKRKIRAVAEVNFINGYNVMAGLIKANEEVEGVVFKGYAPESDFANLQGVLLQGRFPLPQNINEVVLSKKTADRMRLKVGDKFVMYFVQNPPKKRKVKVVGIAELGFDATGSSVMIGNLEQINSLIRIPLNRVGGLEVSLKNFGQLDKSVQSIHEVLPTDIRAYSVVEWFPDIFQWLQLLDVNAELVIVLMLAVAIINMISALLILILERTQFIGLLKALGANNWFVQKIFLFNAAKIIGIGMLLGNLLGLSIGFVQSFTHVLKLDADAYYMAFVPVEIHAQDVLLLNVGTFLVCILIMILPSLLVSSIRPIRAISFK